jgi:hypothetical protein
MSGELDPDSGETLPDNASLPFPNPVEAALDYVAEARGHIIQQYKNSPRLVATIEAIAGQGQAMEEQLVLIPPMDDPAIAAGVNLDVTGELVGQSRVVASGAIVADDTFYRTLIARRIARNISIGTGPEFIAALEALVFPSTPFRFVDVGHMAVLVEVAGAPTADQIALLTESPDAPLANTSPIPRDMAVGVGRVWYDPAEWFGFDEDTRPGAKGFGLESDPSVGGRLSLTF